MSPSPARPDRRAAALLSIGAACLVTAGQDTTLKWLSGSYPFPEMQTIRCGTALACVAAYALWVGGPGSLATPRLGLVLLRGGLLALASALFYVAAAAMPYPEVVALYFTMPLLVAILAGPVLGEHVPLYRWGAVSAGFVGVAIILRPGSALFEPAALVALAAALCYALGNVLTRPLSSTLQAAPLAFWQNVMYLAVALVLSAVFGSGGLHMTGHVSLDYLTRGWLWPTGGDLALIMALGTTTGLLMVLFTLAYRLADASFVAPFEYSMIVWAILFSFLVWNDWPTASALAGIGLIVGSGLFLAVRDR